MGDIFTFLKGFFDGKKPDQNSIPFLHEPIDLDSFPIKEVEEWKTSGGYQSFADLINTSYRDFYITDKTQSKSITILESSYSNGWFLHCENLIFLDEHYKYFAYELSQIIKKLGYTIQVAELKSIAKSEGVELTNHFYLKPSLKVRFEKQAEKANQLFGNISIEYKTHNGVPNSFKFQVNAYSDSKYQEPKNFSDLLDALLRD